MKREYIMYVESQMFNLVFISMLDSRRVDFLQYVDSNHMLSNAYACHLRNTQSAMQASMLLDETLEYLRLTMQASDYQDMCDICRTVQVAYELNQQSA